METRSYSLEEFIKLLEAEDGPQLLTLDTILKEEQRRRYGKKEHLRQKFIGYRKIGLLGDYVEKEPRQGGAGLWHRSQGDLFDFYLNLRKNQQADTISMSNIPVGFWLLEFALGKWIPISIEQVQRAFDHATVGYLEFWNHHAAPIDNSKTSSKISRGIQQASRAFTSEGLKLKTAQDRKLWEDFTHFDQTLYRPGVTLEEFMDSGLRLRDTNPVYQNALKRSYYLEVEARLIGLQFRDELIKPDSRPFWYWAREHWLDAMEWASKRQERFKSVTTLSLMPESANEILDFSILYLLGEFGRGIERIQAGNAISEVPTNLFKSKGAVI